MKREVVGETAPNALARPIEILHVEDNPGDVKLTLRGLAQAKIWTRVTVARDGDEAIETLGRCADCRRSGKREVQCREECMCPDLVLLDLSLPKRSGLEVLAYLKKTQQLAATPVFILTSSRHQADRLRTMKLGANAYLTKPLTMAEFGVMFEALGTWISIVMVEYPESPVATD